MITIATYRDERDNIPVSTEVSWAELVEMLTADNPSPCTSATCIGKKCKYKSSATDGEQGAWSPVVIKDRRKNENVEAVTALVLDADAISQQQLALVAQRVQGASFIVHTTHRHRPETIFIRLVLAISRPVLASEWQKFYANAISGLGFTGIFDPKVKDLSRLFYFPTHPSDVSFLSDSGVGEVLNVDAVLNLDPSVPTPVNASTSSTTESEEEFVGADDAPTEGFVDYGEIVAQLQTYVRSRAQGSDEDKARSTMVRRLLAGEPLAAPGGNAEKTPVDPSADLEPGRGYAIMKVMAALTGYLPANTPDWVYTELFRNSITAMCFGRLDDRAEMEEQVSEKLRLGRIRREKWDEEALERNKKAKAFIEAKERERAAKREVAAASKRGSAVENSSTDYTREIELPTDDWLSKLEFPANTKDGDDKGPKGTAHNVFLILNNAEDFKGCFRWDEVRLRIQTAGPFEKVNPEVLADEVALYLAEKWGVTADAQIVQRQILVIAYRNAFDPIRDYLRGVAWDGTPRVDEWLITYANVDDTPFVRKVGRKWLVGSVARGLNPGVKHDCVLVLEGQQGRRKSTLFEVLGGEFYAAVSLAVADKDSKMVAGRSWISELPDLAALKRVSEINALKAFFATRKDTFRPPFGRAVVDSPRRNSFAGTTNDDEYLADPTGNRRYLCVRCTAPIDQALIARDRDQLWAEAVILYDKHVNDCEDKTTCGCWWFNDAEAEEPELQNRDRMEESPLEILIGDWWEAMTPETRPREMSAPYIAKVALEYSADRITKGVTQNIGTAMKTLGFKKRRKYEGEDPGGKMLRSWVYTPTEWLATVPQSEDGKKMKFKVIKGGVDGGARKE